MSFPETSLSLSLKDALQKRNDVTEKVELSLKMVENEDIYEIFLTDQRDIIRGYSHVKLDSQLQKLCLVDKTNIKFDMRTKYIQHKTKVRIPGIGIGIQVSDHCEKIHCVLDEHSQAVVSDIKLSNICKVKPTFNFFEKTANKSKYLTTSNV